MTRVVFATQVLDAEHPTLGAAAAKVSALAARVDEVVVLAANGRLDGLPANVRCRRFGAPTQALRGLRFEAALARELARGRPVAVLAHMSPVFALLAAPLVRPLRVPLLLWFTQQQAGGALARAEPRVDAILSVDRRSVPIASAKVRAIGHGIDVDGLPCAESPPGGALRLLSLGRYSESKRHDVALRALRRLLDDGVEVELAVRGEEATPRDRVVRAGLAGLVDELRLDGRAQLLDPVPRSQVPALLARTDVLVNATRGAAADKVVLEAAASCVPPVASSPVFDTLLPDELRFPDGDDAALAARLAALAARSAEERYELGTRLRAHVVAEHSAGRWADAVLDVAREARRRPLVRWAARS